MRMISRLLTLVCLGSGLLTPIEPLYGSSYVQAELLPIPRQVHLSWPADPGTVGSSLWSAADLAADTAWFPVTNGLVNNGEQICAALALTGAHRWFSLRPPAPDAPPQRCIKPVIVTSIATQDEERAAGLLADSLRAFGGAYRSAPIYVLLANPTNVTGASLAGRVSRTLALDMENKYRSFPFAVKVHACAQVEALVDGKADWLVWFDPRAVVLTPLTSLEVDPNIGVSIRPVHFQNVGLASRQNLDLYWRTIYAAAGVDTNKIWAVQSFVDGQDIRVYYNCAFMAYRPALGLLRAWKNTFTTLLDDPVLRPRVAADSQHQTYLHQAVLTAVTVARLGQGEINVPPTSYGYPLSVQSYIPHTRQATNLSQLTVALYENSLGSCLTGIAVDPQLAAWLAQHGVRL